nr:MAG TPA: hypothetical protein [Caudoviricetes sp.]
MKILQPHRNMKNTPRLSLTDLANQSYIIH